MALLESKAFSLNETINFYMIKLWRVVTTVFVLIVTEKSYKMLVSWKRGWVLGGEMLFVLKDATSSPKVVAIFVLFFPWLH